MTRGLLILFSTIICCVSCSSDHSFDDFISEVPEFESYQYESELIGYTISLPQGWTLENSVYEKGFQQEVFLEPSSGDTLTTILVSKYKSVTDKLEEEFEVHKAYNSNLSEAFEQVATNETDFLPNRSFYSHVSSKKEYRTAQTPGLDMIMFLTKSENDSTFFRLLVTCPKGSEQLQNMGKLMQCVKDLKTN